VHPACYVQRQVAGASQGETSDTSECSQSRQEGSEMYFAVVCGAVPGGKEIDELLGVVEVDEASQSEAEQAVGKVLARLAAPPERLERYPEFFVYVYSAPPLVSKMMCRVANPHCHNRPEEPDRCEECERLRRENERLRQEIAELEQDLEYQYKETLRAAECAAEDAGSRGYWDGYRDGRHAV